MKYILLFCLISNLVVSQTISVGETTDLSYKGKIGAEHWYYPNEANLKSQPDQQTRLYSSLDLTLQGDFSYQIRLNTRILIDTENSDLNRYEIDDLYIDYFSDSYEVRAGYQIFSWKTVESVSQADFLNQTDLEGDIFDPDKYGELALRIRYIPETETEQTFELYYLPYFRSTGLPTGDNRFAFDLIPGFTDDHIVNEENTYFYESKHGKWAPQFAVRYQTILFGNIDVNLFYFNGYTRFPSIRNDVLPHSDALKKYGTHAFYQHYNLNTKLGFTFQGEIGSWLIKGEAVHTMFKSEVFNATGQLIKPKYLAYTTGFEYTLYSPLVSDQDIGLILELIGDTDSGKKPEELEGFRPFQNHLFTGLRYAFNNISDRTLLIGSFIDYKNDNVIAQVEYEERFLNNFKLKITYNHLQPTTRPLVGFKNNDRLKLNLSYNF